MTRNFLYGKLWSEVNDMRKFLQNLKADKKFRNTVISVTSVVVALAIVLSSVLFITNCNKNKINVDNQTENASDSRAVVAEPESESATIAQSNEESTSQLDEQNSQNESSEPASQLGNVQTEKPNGNGSQAQKPVNNTTTTTKQHNGNTVTTTKTNSGNGGSAVNACKHNWKLMGYGAGCYNYHCSKCDEWKSEEREMNPNDFMGNKSEYLELLGYINKARREAGLNELVYCNELQSGADTRAKELTVSFSHTRPNGKPCSTAYDFSKVNAKGEYIGVGENIVVNASTAEQAFGAWMHSTAHRGTIMKPCATHFVVARCDEYWAMITIGPSDEVLYG